jgi:hypothetical protein
MSRHQNAAQITTYKVFICLHLKILLYFYTVNFGSVPLFVKSAFSRDGKKSKLSITWLALVMCVCACLKERKFND